MDTVETTQPNFLFWKVAVYLQINNPCAFIKLPIGFFVLAGKIFSAQNIFPPDSS